MRWAVIPFFLILFFTLGVVWLWMGGFPLSADAVSTTMARQHAGLDYGGDTVFYPPFFPIVVDFYSSFFDTEEYVISYLFGALFVFFLAANVFWFVRGRLGFRAGVYALLLFSITKLSYVNFLTGEYALLASFGFALAVLNYGQHWTRWPFLVGAVGFHPFGLLALLFLGLIFGLRWREAAIAVISGLVIYWPVIVNFSPSFLAPASFPWLFPVLLPAWIGIVFFVGVVGLWRFEGERIRKFQVLALSTFTLFFICAFIFENLAVKLVELLALSLYAGGGLLLAELEKRMRPVFIFGIFFILGFSFLFLSTQMGELMSGSKASLRDAMFAREFKSVVDEGDSAVFLTSLGGGKIAEFAGVVPVNLLSAHTFPRVPSYYPYGSEAVVDANRRVSVLAESCDLGVLRVRPSWVVVDRSFSGCLFDLPVVFNDGGWVVYDARHCKDSFMYRIGCN